MGKPASCVRISGGKSAMRADHMNRQMAQRNLTMLRDRTSTAAAPDSDVAIAHLRWNVPIARRGPHDAESRSMGDRYCPLGIMSLVAAGLCVLGTITGRLAMRSMHVWGGGCGQRPTPRWLVSRAWGYEVHRTIVWNWLSLNQLAIDRSFHTRNRSARSLLRNAV